MADTFSRAQRSAVMARIKSRDTGPEKAVRSMLHRLGYRFRLHRKDLPGTPDIVLPSRAAVIFVHGCFWHRHGGCKLAKLPSANPDFWRKKLDGNVDRDRKAVEALILLGWRVLTVWECAIKEHELPEFGRLISGWIEESARCGEIPKLIPD